ncbi:phosphoribosylamine--glycine ligase [Alloiococcus sp. CFN-8]|uniref:phosphoribosylamine--glycine ligase n=1 Tax=Alloiococcus sp. CFN-8 TaxID=3416081 RepID=UPI003CF45366
MKLLIVGSGGREHALAWKAAQNPRVQKIFCAPGNGGTALENKCINVNITAIEELAAFAKDNEISLTIVGPEEPLTKGIVDYFKKEGLRCFGPSKKASALEGSKVYSKAFMKKYGVKTAEYQSFRDAEEAKAYLKGCSLPIVIKADGLAAGKGVYICDTLEEAEKAIEEIMVLDIFNGAGGEVVIEEFLQGVEASILSITDGKTIIPFISAKDHKQLYTGGKGPNTGGMGVIAPNPYVTNEVMEAFNKDVLLPTLKGIQEENLDYIGIIFFGIMITSKGVYLLEYNVRLGDPETEAVLPLMDTDLIDLIDAALEGRLSDFNIRWKKECACSVVAASGGYPGSYKKGYPMEIDDNPSEKVFIAGASLNEGKLITSGGRVLCATALGATMGEANSKAYEAMRKISFKDMYYREDIGK